MLRADGVPRKLLEDMNKRSIAAVRTLAERTSSFEMEAGVRQGTSSVICMKNDGRCQSDIKQRCAKVLSEVPVGDLYRRQSEAACLPILILPYHDVRVGDLSSAGSCLERCLATFGQWCITTKNLTWKWRWCAGGLREHNINIFAASSKVIAGNRLRLIGHTIRRPSDPGSCQRSVEDAPGPKLEGSTRT
ncbi:hypothetical protein RB195_013331 [Necator americanus]|uniref:Uncharacterized protein n=1 Tax=Necator americanus TaxID=51031 RepID=A0ABR1DV11_NECAM